MKEYKVVNTNDHRLFPPKNLTRAEAMDELEHHINSLAAEGWILKSSSGLGDQRADQELVLIFKRDKPECGATA